MQANGAWVIAIASFFFIWVMVPVLSGFHRNGLTRLKGHHTVVPGLLVAAWILADTANISWSDFEEFVVFVIALTGGIFVALESWKAHGYVSLIERLFETAFGLFLGAVVSVILLSLIQIVFLQ